MTNPDNDKLALSRRDLLQSAGIATGIALAAPLTSLLAQAVTPAAKGPTTEAFLAEAGEGEGRKRFQGENPSAAHQAVGGGRVTGNARNSNW